MYNFWQIHPSIFHCTWPIPKAEFPLVFSIQFFLILATCPRVQQVVVAVAVPCVVVVAVWNVKCLVLLHCCCVDLVHPAIVAVFSFVFWAAKNFYFFLIMVCARIRCWIRDCFWRNKNNFRLMRFQMIKILVFLLEGNDLLDNLLVLLAFHLVILFTSRFIIPQDHCNDW